MGWAGLVGDGVKAGGQVYQGWKDKATAKENEQLAGFQADDAILRGTIEETRYRREIARTLGAQKAAFGSRNVAVSGTALDLLGDTAAMGEEEVQTIRNNAAREAWGYRNQANEASRWGANQKRNAYGSAAGTLLTSGAQAYGQWKDQ
jgi:hypothetical protein